MISKKNKIFITLFLCFLLLFSNFFCLVNVVNAQVKEDSGVLEDLRRDSNFNILNYPENLKDYSLNVIHLAEGESGAVYLYVYQPSGVKTMLKAKSISLCTKDFNHYSLGVSADKDNSPLFIVYSLELLDYEGTLFKYKVKDYDYTEDVNFQTDGEFDKTLTRNYEISTIYRDFIKGVDTALDSEAIHTIKGLEVGKAFSINTLNDGTNAVSIEVVEVITITDKFVGSMRLKGGEVLSTLSSRDVYFVSFKTDKHIDVLLEADVYYYYTTWTKETTLFGTSYDKRSSGSETVSLNIADTCEWTGFGWLHPEYKYNRIYSMSDFNLFLSEKEEHIKKKNLPDSMKNHEWLLTFAEFDYIQLSSGDYYSETYTSLRDVGIVRLKFITNGVVFNLGVVDDLSTPDTIPDIVLDTSDCRDIDWELLLKLVALIILLILLAPILPSVLSFIFFLLSLPFKFIRFLSKKIKKDGSSNGKKT